MSLGLRARYYCNNTIGHCRYALNDIPFSEQDYRFFEGQCRGHSADGCGCSLIAGEPQNLRPRWLLSGIVAAAVAAGLIWIARITLFPPPLEHVAFATAATQSDDRAGTLQVEVIRNADLNRRIEVKYGSVDGSAKAGADYEAVRSSLTFEPGERSKKIELLLVPDLTLEKGARHFSLALLNVRDHPHHVVRIAPREADRNQQLQAEQMVLTTSRIAADIVSFMVKRRVLLELLTAGPALPGEFAEYKQQLIEVQDNLSRARDGYAQSMRSLQTQEIRLILRTMDRLRDDLAQKNFTQQSRALGIMKTQFTELVNKREMDMDRWARELEAVAPRVPEDDPKISA